MPVERWRGYIKDYDGGKLMECYIHSYIDYSRISEIIKAQKQVILLVSLFFYIIAAKPGFLCEFLNKNSQKSFKNVAKTLSYSSNRPIKNFLN